MMEFLTFPYEIGPNREYASLLSLEWTQRANNCYANLLRVGSSPATDQHIINLDRVLTHFETEGPLSLEQIETISQAEQYFYSLIMQPNIYHDLTQSVKRLNNHIDLLEEIINTVEQKWDSGVSEIEIKNYISEQVRAYYPETLHDAFIEIIFLTATQGKDVRVNLSDEQLSRIKPQVYFKQQDDDVCSTCLENLNGGDQVITLPCHNKHIFHPNCILPWLKISTKCPLCKSDLREFF